MAAFRFRLARVLRVRDVAERDARAGWGAAQREALAAGERAGALRGAADRAGEELARVQQTAPERVPALDAGLLRTWEALRAARARTAELDRAADALRERWVERRRDRRALELLRDRARGEWRREADRREESELAEWASRRRRGA